MLKEIEEPNFEEAEELSEINRTRTIRRKGKQADGFFRSGSLGFSGPSPLLTFHSLLLLGGRILNRMLRFYGALFDLTPKDEAKIYRNLSIRHMNNGDNAKAVGLLKEWMRLDPSNPEVSYLLADALTSVGNHRSALGVINRTLRLDAKYKGALYRKGMIHWKLKNYGEAAEAFEHYIASHPHHAGAHYYLAIACDHTDQVEKAVEAMEKAVELAPQEVKYHQHLGFLYERRGDHQKAAGCFSKVMELEQDGEE